MENNKDNMKEKITSSYEQAKEQIKNKANQISSNLPSTEDIENYARNAGEKTRQLYDNAQLNVIHGKELMEDKIKNNPFSSTVISFITGMIFAKLFFRDKSQ